MYMRFGIVANLNKPQSEILVPKVTSWLEERGETVVDESDLLSADIVLAMGGDGTFLKAARIVTVKDIPILGINLGSFGFLTDVTLEEVFSALELILKNDYKVEERITLSINIESKVLFALNDVVISTNEVGRMIGLAVSVNGQYLSEISCDGLIIATPTGSTAYSLSAGGPIVYPLSDTILITPICAHTLSMRSLILPPESTIKVTPKQGKSMACCDGQIRIPINNGIPINVRKGEHTTKLIKLDISFFAILRKKLGWNKKIVKD